MSVSNAGQTTSGAVIALISRLVGVTRTDFGRLYILLLVAQVRPSARSTSVLLLFSCHAWVCMTAQPCWIMHVFSLQRITKPVPQIPNVASLALIPLLPGGSNDAHESSIKNQAQSLAAAAEIEMLQGAEGLSTEHSTPGDAQALLPKQ